MNKIRKINCWEHPNNRDIEHYVFLWTDNRVNKNKKNPVDVYTCKICEERIEKESARDERMRAHNNKQRDDAYERWLIRIEERSKKRQLSQKNDIWDFIVIKHLSKGIKLPQDKQNKYKESIPKEVLQLTRATMKLNRLITARKEALKNGKNTKHKGLTR